MANNHETDRFHHFFIFAFLIEKKATGKCKRICRNYIADLCQIKHELVGFSLPKFY